MRDILFRGKRIDNGEWVEGYYIKAKHHWHKRGIHEDWILKGASQNGGWLAFGCRYAVIPESVGQYTGLKDKNGKMIFEGDIVKLYFFDGCEEGVIKFNNIMCRFMFFTIDGSYGVDKDCIFEIIGNIHDNPELLKGGAE